MIRLPLQPLAVSTNVSPSKSDGGPASPASTEARGGASDPASSAPAGLKRVANDFEAIFLRQILSSANLGGTKGGQGYAGIAVDALADSISKSGGMGLAHEIERALSKASAPHASSNPSNSTKGAATPAVTNGGPHGGLTQ